MAEDKKIRVKCPSCTTAYKIPENLLGKSVKCNKCGVPFVASIDNAEKTIPAIAKLALKYKTITSKQMDTAIAIYKENQKKGMSIPFEEILLSKNMASASQISLLTVISGFVEERKLDMAFAMTAVKKGYATNDQVNSALKEQERLFREEKISSSVGNIMVEAGILTGAQRDEILKQQGRLEKFLTNDKDKTDKNSFKDEFLAARKKDEEFCRIALDQNYATKEDVSRALKIQVNEFKKGSSYRRVGDILVETGIITDEEKKLILSLQKNAEPKDELSSKFDIFVSDDGLEASLKIKNPSAAFTIQEIKGFLALHKIKYGIVPDSKISEFSSDKSLNTKPFVIARGKQFKRGEDDQIIYHFDTDIARTGSTDLRDKKSIVKVGKLLSEKIPGIPDEKGINVYGEKFEISPTKELYLQSGAGTEMSDDKLKLYAKSTGEVRLSIDGRIFVFSKINIMDDLDLRTGPLEKNGYLNISGIVTDDFQVFGGSLKAQEIRGADVDILGDINISGAINGATIRTQGSVKAKYIHNSIIYAFGDVITENEILDSTILSSHRVSAANSKIISSRISARKGITASGVGTRVSTPCEIHIGADDHIQSETQEIDEKISQRQEDLIQLGYQLELIENKQSELKKELISLSAMKKESTDAFNKISKNLEIAKQSENKKKISHFSTELKKMEKRIFAIDDKTGRVSVKYNGLKKKEEAINKKIKNTTRDVERDVKLFENIKQSYLEWSEKNSPKPLAKVSGHLATGTVISGLHASITLPKSYDQVQIFETKHKGAEDWSLLIGPVDVKST